MDSMMEAAVSTDAYTRKPSNVWTTRDKIESNVRDKTLPPGPYRRGGLLGYGGYAYVYKVFRISDKSLFAGKSTETAQELKQEGLVLKSLSHDHLLRFVDLYENEIPFASLLVTELCAGGSLQDQIDQTTKGLAPDETLQTILQVSQALLYLHQQGLFHCDVKPRNILIRTWDPVNVVLGDCADIKRTSHKGRPGGTPAYWSPQIAGNNHRLSGKSDDIWALGMTLLSMMVLRPHIELTKAAQRKYPKKCFEFAQDLWRLNPEHRMVHLLTRMLSWQPSTRATAADCVQLVTECMVNPLEALSEENQNDHPMGIEAPCDFKPVQFW